MSSSAHVRGTATGAFTGALAIAAHALAGDVLPSAGCAALLLVLAVTAGALTASWPRTEHTPALLGVLAAGQAVGHLALSTGGHVHTESAASLPTPVMALAHLVAIGVGAVLIRGCERLCAALSSIVRRHTHRDAGAPDAMSRPPRFRADQPLQHVLLLAASISHRGPPVGAMR
jgi:hypothetical protein